MAELLQIAVRGVSLRHFGFRQRVAQVGAEVEFAHLGDAPRVGYGLGTMPEKMLQRVWRLQAEVLVGAYEAQGLVNGGVMAGRHQRMLQPIAFRGVIMNVVGGCHRRAGLGSQCGQFPVAPSVAL